MNYHDTENKTANYQNQCTFSCLSLFTSIIVHREIEERAYERSLENSIFGFDVSNLQELIFPTKHRNDAAKGQVVGIIPSSFKMTMSLTDKF